MPAEIQDRDLWQILTQMVFPTAKDPAVIALAFKYCQRRGLDVLKKPVNIVGIWNKALGRSVESIWPAITEIEITASRSKQWAGLDAPVFGPAEKRTFIGRTQISVSFPLWAERTVYRLIAGERRAFTERVHWLESYGRDGGSDVPNYMWAKRPHDQLAKVAKAAALRAAFPEESAGATAEEAEGMIIPGEDTPRQPIAVKDGDRNDAAVGGRDDTAIGRAIDIVNEPDGIPSEPYSISVLNDSDWRPFGEKLIGHIRTAPDIVSITAWLNINKANLDTMAHRAVKLHATLMRSIDSCKESLAAPAPPPPEGSDELPSNVDPEREEGRWDRPAGEFIP
jgi:phage recombination protein Bet